jgi:hypothetical protein
MLIVVSSLLVLLVLEILGLFFVFQALPLDIIDWLAAQLLHLKLFSASKSWCC